MLSRQKGLPGSVRRGLTLLAAMVLAMAGMVVPQQAGAAPGTGSESGEETQAVVDTVVFGPVGAGSVGESAGGKGTANQTWDKSNDSFQVKITASGSSLATNYCIASLLDWDRVTTPGTSDHMDMRGAQSCDAGYGRNSGAQNDAGYTFAGAQKLAGCYGPVNNTDAGNCTNHTYATLPIAGSNTDFGGTCLEGWVTWKGGGTDYFTGGNPISCTS